MRFSPGCSCCSCGTIVVTVRLCSDNSLVSGATVTVYDDADAEVGTCTTDGTGICSVDIPAAGDYTVTVAKSGHATLTRSVAATCTTNGIAVTIGRVITVTAQGCRPIVGATVTATLSGVVYSAVTTATGVASLPVSSTGTYAIAVTESSGRYVAYASTAVVSTCSTSHFAAIAAASGYHCANWNGTSFLPATYPTLQCAYPLADTLFLTDSIYGPVTLVWSSAMGGGGGSPGWYGAVTVSYPGSCDVNSFCPAGVIQIRYYLAQTSSRNPISGKFWPLTIRTTSLELPGTPANSCCPGPFDPLKGDCVDVGEYAAASDITCPVSGAFLATFQGSDTSLYCGTPTYTITE